MVKFLFTNKFLVLFVFAIIISFVVGYILAAYQSNIVYNNAVQSLYNRMSNMDLSQAVKNACSGNNYQVSFDSFRYCNGTLSGTITNRGQMGLWIFSLDVYYPNSTVRKIYLTPQLGAGQSYYFVETNVPKGYGEMVLVSNCTYVGQEIAPDRIATC